MSDTAHTIRRIGIIGAMEQETELLLSRLQQPESHRIGDNILIHTGQLCGKEIALCQSGIGKVSAAVATTLLIQNFAPDCVINTGSAGGIGPGLKVGDVVIGTETAHHDADVTAFGYAYGQLPKQPARFVSAPVLAAAASQAAQTFGQVRIVRGLIVSGDQFVHDAAELQRIKNRFADAQAVEMEAAAIAQSCHLLGTPFVVIRAVSDSADEAAQISFETFLETAARHSAEMVSQLIQNL